MENIEFPEGVTTFERDAFTDCLNLENVVFPSTVTSIGFVAFRNCQKLKGLYFKGNAPAFHESFPNAGKAVIYYQAGTYGWGENIEGRSTAVWDPQKMPAEMKNGGPTNQWFY